MVLDDNINPVIDIAGSMTMQIFYISEKQKVSYMQQERERERERERGERERERDREIMLL